ncbi:MAG: helix-turn-helix transcriptional regulator [Candidatus Eremiobacteraeota bacterium]|nr:helix-turn-helix transcriptional regulator [Candidatus Eremiobacteraeota bacterium]
MHLRKKPAALSLHRASEGSDALSPFCQRYQFAAELVGRRWVGAILRILLAGPRRFNEILGGVPGLSDRLLAERLRELEEAGVVTRRVHDERPVRVSYELTECGRSLEPVVRAVAEWAEAWVQ